MANIWHITITGSACKKYHG